MEIGFLNDINTLCEKNTPGIECFWLIEWEYIISWKATGLEVTEVKLSDGTSFNKLIPLKENLFIEETSNDSPHNTFFNFSLPFSLPKDIAEHRNLANNIRNRVLALIYKDKNGEHRFVPKVRCNANYNSGSSNSRNQFNFQLFKSSKTLSAYILPTGFGEVETEIGGDFSDDFNTDFYI